MKKTVGKKLKNLRSHPVFMNFYFWSLCLQGKPGWSSRNPPTRRLNFFDILRRQRRRLTSLFQNKPWQQRALIRQPKPRRGLGPRTPSDHWNLRCLLSKFLFNSHFRCWWADLNASFLSRFQNNPRLMKENTVPESNCFIIFVQNRFSQFHCTSSQASKLSCSRSVKSESYQQGKKKSELPTR